MSKLLNAPRLCGALRTLAIGLFFCAAPNVARAQVKLLDQWLDPNYGIVINSPTEQIGGGRIDCAPRQSGCKPMNLARCTDPTPMPINFSINPRQGTRATYTGSTQVLYAFLSTTGTCAYSMITGQVGNNPNLLIGLTPNLAGSAPFFTGGTQSFLFPGNITSFSDALPQVKASRVFTVADMMGMLGACGPTPRDMSTYTLCIGVDATGSQGINNTASTSATNGQTQSGSDPVTFLNFQVDTVPPAPPTLQEVQSLNGRARIKVQYVSPLLDLYEVRVKYSSRPENLQVPCNLWTEDVHVTPAQSAFGQVAGDLVFMVNDLDNDVDYAFCAESEDYMQNPSEPTANTIGHPRFECDLFGCYPGTLATGYCGQVAAPQLWLGALLALGARTLGRRRQSGGGACLGLVFALCLGLITPKQAQAFEEVDNQDVLRLGPSMGPIDAERPAPKYLKKESVGEVTGNSLKTKSLEDFSEPGLDFNPFFAEALPRWGVEFRFGPYRPAFSNSRGGQDLYRLIMVDDGDKTMFRGRPIMLALEGDYYFWRGFGLLGAYGRIGYWNATGPSRACVAADGVTPVPCSAATVLQSNRGGDSAGLTDMPLSLGAVYRFDYLKRRTPVPLIFSAKVGLDGHLWFGSSAGRRARYNGHKAKGATYGYQASVGMSLNVDGLAKRALSRIRDRVENSLFIEYATVRGRALIGPDRGNRLNFTDNRMVTVGLSCEFK